VSLDDAVFANQAEFYSPHYLDEVLDGDLLGLRKKWNTREKDHAIKVPGRRVGSLANSFFAAMAKAQDQRGIEERLTAARAFHAALLDALGFAYAPVALPLENGQALPALVAEDRDGRPYLWILEAPFPLSEADDPLEEKPSPLQLPESAAGAPVPDSTYRELLDGEVFVSDHSPRWVLFLAGTEVMLIDRLKWAQGKCLRASLGELFGRRQTASLEAFACLFHKEALNPDDGPSLHDTLEDNSHKHAYVVSTDLKRGAQKAIELLANEAVHYRREVLKLGVFDDPELAPKLTADCLKYLYRLLFLFYVEARGTEPGVVPMDSASYREGYSLEALRNLELVPLTTAAARDGFFIHHSLERLFALVYRGFGTTRDEKEKATTDGFQMPGARSPLFDPLRTPTLKGVKFRNSVLQKVIELLSLSEVKGRRGRGRISYANLGINQLGSVYEGLLSYTGFFAREDLYEVRRSGKSDARDADERRFFVGKGEIGKYQKAEIVRDSNGDATVYKKGKYLFQLSGRGREESASYYTPEVLTQCLTKYTLQERLKNLTADQILDLTICEPAMGSGAFLNEAIGQLADAYLERKQRELGVTIASSDYVGERQRVKYHLAVHNAYGVDLNPLATELAKVSLYLNILHDGARAPYFNGHLAIGNSLVGGRREVFRLDALLAPGCAWLKEPPTPVPVGGRRPDDAVYHFLVPDLGMAAFDGDKVVAALAPKPISAIKEWRRNFVAPFTREETTTLLRLSREIDELWQQHYVHRRDLKAALRQPVPIWGQTPVEGRRWISVEESEELAAALHSPSSAGRRLRATMDYWCALWFWPVQQSAVLPSRDEWLVEIEALLLGDVDAVAVKNKRLQLVRSLSERCRFHHWELAFAEVFGERGGFDVLLGNPPWIKVEWNEQLVLGDLEPLVAVRDTSAAEVAKRRPVILSSGASIAMYLEVFETQIGTCAMLNAAQNYPLLKGVQTNLFKCFIARAWGLANESGSTGLVHPDGVYDDPGGGALRAEMFARLRMHFQFQNELMLFEQVHDRTRYSLNVYAGRQSPDLATIANLFHPSTIDASYAHDGQGPPPGIKTDDNRWDLRGHRARIVRIDEPTLDLFARLYDDPGTPAMQARLPVVHSAGILNVLRKLASAPRRLADLSGQYFGTVCFDETNQQKDGTIRRETRQAKRVEDWIVSGPHFHVANPFNKTPNEGCKHNQDYAWIDLADIRDDFLPRANYVPACSNAEYRARTPTWNGRVVTAHFRHANRRMVAPTGERSLISCIIPPGAAHIDGVFSAAFASSHDLVAFNGMAASLVCDFLVKSGGKTDLRGDVLKCLPITEPYSSAVTLRTLRLNCLTIHYAPLWEELYTPEFNQDHFCKRDPRLNAGSHLSPKWKGTCALRTPYERRQALVELDALAALSLGLTADELCLIYRVQFPVLQQYERETFYDQRGAVVFTTNRGQSDVGLTRQQWDEVKDVAAGTKLPTFAKDFVAPFDRCDREDDMRAAYDYFASRVAQTASAPSNRRVKSVPPLSPPLRKTSSRSPAVPKKAGTR
jgi:hypothetical protein